MQENARKSKKSPPRALCQWGAKSSMRQGFLLFWTKKNADGRVTVGVMGAGEWGTTAWSKSNHLVLVEPLPAAEVGQLTVGVGVAYLFGMGEECAVDKLEGGGAGLGDGAAPARFVGDGGGVEYGQGLCGLVVVEADAEEVVAHVGQVAQFLTVEGTVEGGAD